MGIPEDGPERWAVIYRMARAIFECQHGIRATSTWLDDFPSSARRCIEMAGSALWALEDGEAK